MIQSNPYLTSVLEARFEESRRLLLTNQIGQFRLSKNCGIKVGHEKYYLVEVGPGLFPCEEHSIDLTLHHNQKVLLQAQSATKVMSSRTTEAAKINLKIVAMDGSSLIYLCEPTIMLPNSSLESKTDLYLGRGAKLIYSDIVGQPFPELDPELNCNLLNTQLRIFTEGELQYADSIVVEPNPILTAAEAWRQVFSNSLCAGACYIVGYPARRVEKIIRDLAEISVSGDCPINVSTSSITPELTLTRVHSTTSGSIKTFFESSIEAITSQF